MSEAAYERIKWYRCKVEGKQLKELSQKSDLKGFLQAGGHLALLACTGTAAFFSAEYLPWYVTLLLVFVHGTCWSFLTNGFHELIHGTVFKTKALNTAFLNIYSFLGMNNPVVFWASHMAHHKFTLHPPRDLETVDQQCLTWRQFFLSGFISPQEIYPTFRRWVRQGLLGKVQGEWQQSLFPESDVEGRKALFRWARILLLGHLVIIAGSLLMGWWMIPILVTGAKFYGRWLLFILNNTQHAGLPDHIPDFRKCCRTIKLNPFLRFLYWQMNYHIEHHMYASVPCYNLGKIHKLIEKDLPPTPGIIETWKEILQVYRLRKEDPDFVFDQFEHRIHGFDYRPEPAAT